MIEQFLVPEINRVGLQNIWLQQDGATAFTAREKMDALRQISPDCIISKYDDVNWHAHSPNLTGKF